MSVTAAEGFRAAGVTAGLKVSGKPDLALVVNDGSSKSAAAVFTSNRLAAAPVQWSRGVLSDGCVGAVILNSGGANSCTGTQGFENARATAEVTAAKLGISAKDVVVCSTGIIGEHLPMQKVVPGIDVAVRELADDAGSAAAAAIMTTDTVSKESVLRCPGYTIGGMAKGAGMLAPGLATMLVVLTTDADLDSSVLDRALRTATRTTFGRADSDGCMSTNDTVLLMASGESHVRPDHGEFTEGLTRVCDDLARQLIADAEGASHAIAITTLHAATERDAEVVSRAVARSNLFKAAVFGNDPNWGRVLAAVGTTDAVFRREDVNVSMNGVEVCRGGSIGEAKSLVDLTGYDVTVEIDLGAGDAAATILTNDLTYVYVEENAMLTT